MKKRVSNGTAKRKKTVVKRHSPRRRKTGLSLIPKSKAKNAYELLDEVKKLILAEPKRYNQENWMVKQKDYGQTLPYDARKGFSQCGKVACVAGWVATLKPGIGGGSLAERARQILGIGHVQSYELFDGAAISLSLEPQTPAYAKAGVEHIERFQERHQEQLLAQKV